jgi:hypothetical protein
MNYNNPLKGGNKSKLQRSELNNRERVEFLLKGLRADQKLIKEQ